MQATPFVQSYLKAATHIGPQGQRLISMIDKDLCGSNGLSGCFVAMPPSGIAKLHSHDHTEHIIAVIEGYAATLIGDTLTPYYHGPGDFLFVPPHTTHIAVNLSTKHRIIALEIRSNPLLEDDILVETDTLEQVKAIVEDLQDRFAKHTLDTPQHWNIDDMSPFLFKEA